MSSSSAAAPAAPPAPLRFPFRAELAPLTPYPPGKPIEEVQREFGLTSEVVKLASNENPCGPSPRALEALAREASQLHLYPEGGCHYLREALAERLGVAREQLLFGNGSDEIVALMCMAYLRPGDNIVVGAPTFIRYEMGATSMGAETRRVPMIPETWTHDTAGMRAAIDGRTRFVFLPNPDNPVGTAVPHQAVAELLAALPASVVLVLDEAYFEYAAEWNEYPRALELLAAHPNLAIMRTFSKAYGLAGLRIGYGIGAPELWNGVERLRPPFNVNRLAQVAAQAALEDTAHLQRTVQTNTAGREYVASELQRLGLQPIGPSRANFVLADFKRPVAELYTALLQRGVIVRPMAMYGLTQHLRVSVGLAHENEFFIAALRDCL